MSSSFNAKVRSLLLGVSLALFGVQCSSGSSGSDANALSGDLGPATFASVAALLQSKCASCHGADPILSGVTDLRNDAGLYTRLTTPISGAPALLGPSCNGQLLVNLQTPAQSLLPKIVSPNPPCSIQMPEGCGASSCLKTAELTLIQNWINSGATQN
ncbi:MAG TPA: hypothetical protein VNW92_16730 [Polyangiaceae bacterium]|nr:hypothetical protein [Polyangiaceae bacterium]